jgi:hypothetical protein
MLISPADRRSIFSCNISTARALRRVEAGGSASRRETDGTF